MDSYRFLQCGAREVPALGAEAQFLVCSTTLEYLAVWSIFTTTASAFSSHVITARPTVKQARSRQRINTHSFTPILHSRLSRNHICLMGKRSIPSSKSVQFLACMHKENPQKFSGATGSASSGNLTKTDGIEGLLCFLFGLHYHCGSPRSENRCCALENVACFKVCSNNCVGSHSGGVID